MKQRPFSLILPVICMVLACSLASAAPSAQDPRTMAFDPVKIPTPNAERVVLDNGMIVYLLPDAELPVVTLSAVVRTGSIYDPAEKIGLAELTGGVMRTGGSAKMSADQIDEELEYLAANISIGIGTESGGASLDILKKDFQRGVGIFADLLRRPAFDPAKLDLAKRQTLETIRRRNDNPSSVTGREFRKLIYGAHHPFGRESTVETVSSITRDDLVAFHRQYFKPNAIILGVSGDFERSQMLAALNEVFGDWKQEPLQLPTVPPVAPVSTEAGRPVFVIQRNLTQTHLRVGQLSVRENDPDYFALALLDDILGGNSFTSRLFRDVRSRQGLAYSVGSAIRPGHLAPGVLLMHALTKAPTTYQALNSMLEQFDRLRREPVSDSELQHAKDAFLNSFVFSFADAGQIVGRLVELEYNGLPPDFLQRFRDGIMKLTKEDLLRVAQKHLDPGRLIILAVGKDQDFEKPLASFGPVTVLPLKPGT